MFLRLKRKSDVSAKRVVVDTNVIVSGLLGTGFPGKIIEAWLFGEIHPVISQDLKTEVNRILLKPSVREMLGAKNIANTKIVLGTLFNKALIVLPRTIDEEIFPDKNDHFLWELAVTAKAQAIVTGDKHLSKLKKIKGIEILSPEQFCQRRRL